MELDHLMELADASIGTPEVGAINFNALHRLMLALITKIGLLEKNKTSRTGSSHNHAATDDKLDEKPNEGMRQGRLSSEDSTHQLLQQKIIKLEQSSRVSNILPRPRDMMQLVKTEQPIPDLYNYITLSKKIEANDDALKASMQMMQEIVNDARTINTDLDVVKETLKRMDEENSVDTMRSGLQKQMDEMMQKLDYLQHSVADIEKMKDALGMNAYTTLEREDSPTIIPVSPSVPITTEVTSQPEVARSEPKVNPIHKTKKTNQAPETKSKVNTDPASKDSAGISPSKSESSRLRHSSIPEKLEDFNEQLLKLKGKIDKYPNPQGLITWQQLEDGLNGVPNPIFKKQSLPTQGPSEDLVSLLESLGHGIYQVEHMRVRLDDLELYAASLNKAAPNIPIEEQTSRTKELLKTGTMDEFTDMINDINSKLEEIDFIKEKMIEFEVLMSDLPRLADTTTPTLGDISRMSAYLASDEEKPKKPLVNTSKSIEEKRYSPQDSVHSLSPSSSKVKSASPIIPHSSGADILQHDNYQASTKVSTASAVSKPNFEAENEIEDLNTEDHANYKREVSHHQHSPETHTKSQRNVILSESLDHKQHEQKAPNTSVAELDKRRENGSSQSVTREALEGIVENASEKLTEEQLESELDIQEGDKFENGNQNIESDANENVNGKVNSHDVENSMDSEIATIDQDISNKAARKEVQEKMTHPKAFKPDKQSNMRDKNKQQTVASPQSPERNSKSVKSRKTPDPQEAAGVGNGNSVDKQQKPVPPSKPKTLISKTSRQVTSRSEEPAAAAAAVSKKKDTSDVSQPKKTSQNRSSPSPQNETRKTPVPDREKPQYRTNTGNKSPRTSKMAVFPTETEQHKNSTLEQQAKKTNQEQGPDVKPALRKQQESSQVHSQNKSYKTTKAQRAESKKVDKPVTEDRDFNEDSSHTHHPSTESSTHMSSASYTSSINLPKKGHDPGGRFARTIRQVIYADYMGEIAKMTRRLDRLENIAFSADDRDMTSAVEYMTSHDDATLERLNRRLSSLTLEMSKRMNNLDEELSSLMESNFGDEERMIKAQLAINDLQEQLESVRKVSMQLRNENDQKKQLLEDLNIEIDRLNQEKVDSASFQRLMSIKAGKLDLELKVNRSEFELVTSDIQAVIDDLLGKLSSMEEAWKKAHMKLEGDVATKLDNDEIERFKTYIDRKHRELNVKLKKQMMLSSTENAAGMRRKAPFNCLSCDKPISFQLQSGNRSGGDNCIHKPNQYTAADIEQIEQQIKKEWPEDTLELTGTSRKNMKAYMVHFGNKTTPKVFLTRSKSRLSHIESEDIYGSPRPCGGKHTVTIQSRVGQSISNGKSIVLKDILEDNDIIAAATIDQQTKLVVGADGKTYQSRDDVIQVDQGLTTSLHVSRDPIMPLVDQLKQSNGRITKRQKMSPRSVNK